MQLETITGQLILIMGPTGSGKSSIVTFLLETFRELHYSVSCTTRVMRPGEIQDKEYHFISREAFQKKIDEDAFLEWTEFSGNFYGTLRSEVIDRLTNGEVLITEIELQGVQALSALIPEQHRTTIFIDAGDWESLTARVVARAPISDTELALRFERYQHEILSKPYADYVIDNTDGHRQEANEHMVAIIQDIIAKVTTP